MKRLSGLDLNDQVRPQLLDPNVHEDAVILESLKITTGVQVIDEIESQVGEWIKLQNPTKIFNAIELQDLVQDFFSEKDKNTFGNWVYYPWRNCLVHILHEAAFAEVRTSRNKYKITHEEQDILSTKKIGIVGLSVGQSVALALALERGFGELRIADFDTLELGNMNRIRTGLTNLGLKKTTIAAREILELDPYLTITVFDEGITEDNIDAFFNDGGKLDLLIDECDSLDIKILLREKARSFRIPVVMDTSDRGMLDVERFDLEPEREIFHGNLGEINYRSLKSLSTKDKVSFVLKITGVETLSSRMKASLLEINQSITSWPQLASAVFLGGALGAHSARNILLGHNHDSGRFYVDLDELLQKEQVSSPEVLSKEDQSRLNDSLKNLYSNTNGLNSSYRLSEEELNFLIAMANQAPSGGNCQPWHWVFDRNGILHLVHDKSRSTSLLDFKGTGSLIAFGAALENLRIALNQKGIKHTILVKIKEFEEDEIASITFHDKVDHPISDPYLYLFPHIEKRMTNRLNQKRVDLPNSILDELLEIVSASNCNLKIFDQESKITQIAKINGEMDWVRMINNEGYKDFVNEVRWTDKDASETRDGVDLATLDLSVADIAALKLISNRKAMQFIRDHKLGKGFTQISDKTFFSASAICLLSSKKFSAQGFLEAGQILQRIWTHCNSKNISFQPVTASLFLYHNYFRGNNKVFSTFEADLIENNYKKFKSTVGLQDDEHEIFLFRLNITNGPVVRSYRREVRDTLILS